VQGKNAVNPDGFTSILTKLQRKILVSKSDSGLNALAKGTVHKIYLQTAYSGRC